MIGSIFTNIFLSAVPPLIGDGEGVKTCFKGFLPEKWREKRVNRKQLTQAYMESGIFKTRCWRHF